MSAEAAKRLALALPHMREAVEMARDAGGPEARVCFAIITRNPDGSGRVTGEFECDEFLADVEALIGGAS